MTTEPTADRIDPRFPTEVVIELGYEGHGDDHDAPGPRIERALDEFEAQLVRLVGERGQYAGRAAEGWLAQLVFYVQEDVDLVRAMHDLARTWDHGGVDVRPL